MRPSSTPHVLPKQEPTRGSAQGPPTQRQLTTTASCRSRNWPVVRASVGVSEVVRSTAVDRGITTLHRSGGRFASRPPKIYLPFLFLGPMHPFPFLSLLCFFFPIDLRLFSVCVVIDITCNICVVVYLGWQAVQSVFSGASSKTYATVWTWHIVD